MKHIFKKSNDFLGSKRFIIENGITVEIDKTSDDWIGIGGRLWRIRIRFSERPFLGVGISKDYWLENTYGFKKIEHSFIKYEKDEMFERINEFIDDFMRKNSREIIQDYFEWN